MYSPIQTPPPVWHIKTLTFLMVQIRAIPNKPSENVDFLFKNVDFFKAFFGQNSKTNHQKNFKKFLSGFETMSKRWSNNIFEWSDTLSQSALVIHEHIHLYFVGSCWSVAWLEDLLFLRQIDFLAVLKCCTTGACCQSVVDACSILFGVLVWRC